MPTEILPDLYRIRLPLAKSVMRYVNSYLMRDGDGCALIDCGYETPDGLEALRGELRDLGMELDDLHTLIVTHGHRDHYGLACTLMELVRPRLLMHRVDWLNASSQPADSAAAEAELMGWMELNGLPVRSWSDDEIRAMFGMRQPTPVAPDVQLEDGDRIQVGQHDLQVIWTPGHSEGHICLYDAGRRVLLAGDHLLDPITPHVTTSRPIAGDPLGGCMNSLRRVAALDVELVLPGHGDSFAGNRKRAEELLAHHEHRETEVLSALSPCPTTAARIATTIPWSRRSLTFDQLHPSRKRAALGQTVAHLEKLRGEGIVHRVRQNGLVYYERVPGLEDTSRSDGTSGSA